MYTQFYQRRAKTQTAAMAPRKAAKANVEVTGQGSDNVSDTSPRSVESISDWSFVSNILQAELVDYSDDSDDVERDDLHTKYKIIVQSGMHRIATRPRLLPYYDMIRWALDHVDLPTRTIMNNQRVTVGTFRPEHLQTMYKLPSTSEYTYGADFLEEFKEKECTQYDKTMSGLIKDWVSRAAKFRASDQGVYSISSLEPQYKYVAMMTCRLFGREDTSHFYIGWVPLMFRVAEGCSFNWAKMLSDSLANRVTEYREQKASGKPSSFFMSAYIMDAVCSMTPFPLMSWAWNPAQEKPVHEYHDKLWENKAGKFTYEIFNWVMVPLHITIFGHPPPRVSDNIATGLSGIADWYVEAEFSYIRVFGASVPPHALPLFIPDKLACREVAWQTVIGGVSKELKGYSKKVWPSFPIRMNSYSLLDFGHAKAEAAALEDLRLVSIEIKKHDPQKVVSNHLAHCGLKRFEHENSPSDDIFRGARSYEEVLARIQSLAPEDTTSVLKFQEHRRRCLPAVLGGSAIAETKQKDAEDSADVMSNPGQQQEGEQTSNPEAKEKTPDPPSKQNSEAEEKTPDPPRKQIPETERETPGTPKEQNPVDTPKESAKQIGEPITSVTPLQSAQGNVSEGWIFDEELRPIRAEELPPNEFFFDKKRKAVVKREFYQEGESTAKKYKIMTDGKNKKSDQLATEIAGTLGAYASANQFSVGQLNNQLKRKNRLIRTLEARLATATENAKGQASMEMEQARVADKNEIEVLKAKLEQAHLVIRDGRIQAGQQRTMITELQAQLEVAESRVIDVEGFKSRAIDIRSRISSVQQSLLDKVGVIREDCLLMHRISENLTVRERNAEAARVAFQEAVIATNNRVSAGSPGLTISEQTRGNILLKDWEHNITLGKEQAQKVTNSLEEAFNAIDGELLGMESGGDAETLMQMNVEQISLDLKEKNERDSTDISQMDRVDMAQVDKHLIQPSAQLSALDIVDAQMGDKLQQLARECYFAEASCQAEPSQLVSQFVEKCSACTESAQRRAPGTN
jgi:hypothetical protein